MLALAFVLSLIAAYVCGYYHRTVMDKLSDLASRIASSNKQEEVGEEESKSTLIDPDDLESQIRWEHEETMRKLNGAQ